MNVTAYDVASRFIGLREIPGKDHNPHILAMLKLDDDWPESDEVSWCSAFTNYICWLLDLPRSKSLAARSWLNVGSPIPLPNARQGDVLVFWRGVAPAPDEPLDKGPGHVGFFAGQDNATHVQVLGGNQADTVSIASYPRIRLLGVRRIDP